LKAFKGAKREGNHVCFVCECVTSKASVYLIFYIHNVIAIVQRFSRQML